MKVDVDTHTGDKWIELSKDEIKMGFLAQCVEALAEADNCNYTTMFNRLEAADMTEGYILRHYEPLHTQSWESILAELKGLLYTREFVESHNI